MIETCIEKLQRILVTPIQSCPIKTSHKRDSHSDSTELRRNFASQNDHKIAKGFWYKRILIHRKYTTINRILEVKHEEEDCYCCWNCSCCSCCGSCPCLISASIHGIERGLTITMSSICLRVLDVPTRTIRVRVAARCDPTRGFHELRFCINKLN